MQRQAYVWCKHTPVNSEHVSKTDTEEKKLLNKVIIFVLFVYKNILVAS